MRWKCDYSFQCSCCHIVKKSKCRLPYQWIFELLTCADLFSCIVENYLDDYHLGISLWFQYLFSFVWELVTSCYIRYIRFWRVCHREEAPRRCYFAHFPSSQFIKTTFTHFTRFFCFCPCVCRISRKTLWPFIVADDKSWTAKGHDVRHKNCLQPRSSTDDEFIPFQAQKPNF